MNNKKSDKKYSTYAAKTSFVKMKILTTKVKLSLQKNISINLLSDEEKDRKGNRFEKLLINCFSDKQMKIPRWFISFLFCARIIYCR